MQQRKTWVWPRTMPYLICSTLELDCSSKFRTSVPLVFQAIPSFIPVWMTLVCIWWHSLMWWGQPLIMFRVRLITAINVVSCLASGPVWVRIRWGDGIRAVKWSRLCEWWASDFTWISWLLNILLFFLKTVFLTWLESLRSLKTKQTALNNCQVTNNSHKIVIIGCLLWAA